VSPNFFDVFGVRVVTGRAFTGADVAWQAARPVIVNRTFVDRMPVGGNVVGRRIRFPLRGDTTQREWREIVGVVEDFPAGNIGVSDPGDTRATLYEPMAPGEVQGATLFVRMRGRAEGQASRLRAIATAADPSLQLRRVQSLENAYAVERRDLLMAALALVLVIGSVLLLSAAGMYALMSFTVSQRRREIGVRAALGADARHILTGVLARAARQLFIGVVAGLSLVVVVDRAARRRADDAHGAAGDSRHRHVHGGAGMIAAVEPARHGLRIQPSEALRSE
jgi:hypothetical protein